MQSVCNTQRVQLASGAQCRKATVNALLRPCCATSLSQVRSPKPFTASKASVISTVARRSAARPVLSRAKASRSTAVSVRAEISYVMVKPDGVQRGLVGEIISRFERKGFKLVGLKLFQTPSEVAEEHYKDLKSKPFYPALVGYITSGPVVAMVWEGKGVVASARKLIGATNPLVSEPGTIRGDFAIEVGRNVIHGSDSPENGERETALWFSEGTVSWEPAITPWLKE